MNYKLKHIASMLNMVADEMELLDVREPAFRRSVKALDKVQEQIENCENLLEYTLNDLQNL